MDGEQRVDVVVESEEDYPFHSGSSSVLVKRQTIPPISVRDCPPGPGTYELHPLVGFIGHDATKYREPYYSFRPKTPQLKYDTPGPGPAVHVETLLTRFGKHSAPKYTLRCKCSPKPPYRTPAPPDYKKELVRPTEETIAPVWSIRRRFRYPPGTVTPAPNRYHMPAVIGRDQPWFPDDPGWTAAFRNQYNSFLRDLAKTPGPAAHRSTDPNIYRPRSPVFTLRQTVPLPVPFNTPGPGTYKNELVKLHKPTIPAFTFGYKHSMFAGAMTNKVLTRCRPVPKIHSRKLLVSCSERLK